MIRRIDVPRVSAALLLAATLCPATARAEPILLHGVVRADNAEAIFVPPSNSQPVVLRFYVPDGTRVDAGQVVVRIDPGASLSQIKTLESQIEQAQARGAKELAELKVKAIDAERARVDARAALDKAEVDAGIPREHLSALDFDRYHGELERAGREYGLKQKEQAAAEDAVQRRAQDAELEIGKLQAERGFHALQVAGSEQRAEAAGTVIHGFDNWRGTRYDEGSSAHPGNRIGEIVGDGGMQVRAHVLEPDRRGLDIGQSIRLSFDALPAVQTEGRIERIAGAPEPKAEWGEGRYFTVDISLPTELHSQLKPGMSVRGEIDTAVQPAQRIAETNR